MKIQELLVDFFYKEKYLTLQGIGTFKFDASVNIYSDEDAHLIKQAISFEANKKATEDAALIQYISIHSGKMKSLASSDLESFLSTAIELLNIGKPFALNGIGILTKTQGGLEFIASGKVHAILEEKRPENLFTDKTIETEEEEAAYQLTGLKSKKTSRIWIGVIGATIILAISAWIVYYFILQKKSNTTSEQAIITTDSIFSKSDSALQKSNTPTKDTTLLDSTIMNNKKIDSTSEVEYTIIIQELFSKFTALKRFNKLYNGNKNIKLETNLDSSLFRIVVPYKSLLKDTIKIKDSINLFYDVKCNLRLKNN